MYLSKRIPSIISRAVHASAIVCLVLFLIDAIAPSSARAEVVRDKKHGIVFKAAKDWVSIPVEPGDDLTLHKFQAERADRANKLRGVAMNASLNVLFFPAKAAETGSQTPAPNKTKQIDALAPDKGYKNFNDYLQRRLIKSMGAKMNGKPKKGRSKKNPLMYYRLTRHAAAGSYETLEVNILAAVYDTIDGEFVFQFTCIDEHYKKRHKRDMESMIRSFGRIEKDSQAERDAELESMSENERYIQEQVDKLSSGWYSFWSRNKNYMIFSNAEMRFAKKISKNLEEIHDCFVKMFPGEPKVDWIPIVRVCKTANEYYGYGGPRGSAGYWSDHTREFVFYDDVEGGEKNSMIVLRHEAFHHFIHFYIGGRPSTWYDEGHADYFSGFEFRGKSVKVKPSSWRRGTIQRFLVNREHVPLKKFVHLTKREYYARATLCYAQGWSFIYFLREGKKGGARMQKKWLEIPDRYLENLQAVLAELKEKERSEKKKEEDENKVEQLLAAKAQKEAMARTFAGWTDKDWEQLEKEWIDFIK